MQTIGVIEGDGVGPEVMSEALHVLELVSRQDQLAFHIERFDLGAERYLRTGEVLPEAEQERLRQCDAILLGAVGDPRVPPGVLATPRWRRWWCRWYYSSGLSPSLGRGRGSQAGML